MKLRSGNKMGMIAAQARAVALVAAGLAAGAGAAHAAGTLVVTGQGQVLAAPDMASITLGVGAQAPTAAEALRGNSEKLSAVLERLKADGMEARDIQTSGLNLGPQMEYSQNGGAPKVVGYEASNMLTLRVRDLGKLGAILDQAVGDGANVFHGLEFGHAASEPLMDEARAKAVSDARRKAEQIAAAAGVGLGRILSMEEGERMAQPRPMMRAERAVMASAVPVEGGEVGYTVSVTITWEIAQP